MKTRLKIFLVVGLPFFWVPGFSQELKPPQIFLENSQSVVRVLTFDKNSDPIAQGSGVVVTKDLVATNCHVVSDSEFVGIQLGRDRTFAKIEKSYQSDLCLLRMDSSLGKPIRLSSSKPVPGEKVYTLGHPLGLDLSISEGLISGFRVFKDGHFLQISAPISPGSSGGALLNSHGHLVGITTREMSNGQNLNFAAPISDLSAEISKRLKAESTTANLQAPPVPDLTDPSKRREYLEWLGSESEKLKKTIPDWPERRDLLQTVWYESERAGLDKDLVLALIQTLSQFRKFHVTKDGARGYMQIAPTWSKILGNGDAGSLFHMQTNLRFGCVLLRHFMDLNKGNVNAALETYLVRVAGYTSDKTTLTERVNKVMTTKISRMD